MIATIEERYDSMANFLFNEGWRSSDWMEIKARYDISDEETDAICERLAVLQIKRAKAVLEAKAKRLEDDYEEDESESFLTDEEKADLWDTEANWIDRV